MTAILNWGVLIGFGAVMYFVSPKAVGALREAQFFKGRDKANKEANMFFLTSSVLIAWIFAKSIQNCANLGQTYGLPGGVAYATYWLAFPVAGWSLYRLRSQGFVSIHHFLTSRFGHASMWLFSFILCIRLWNEIWSNTMVIAQYFGEPGSHSYLIASWATTIMVLLYVMKGGLRTSIITDTIHMMLAAVLLFVILAVILPRGHIVEMATSGSWTLAGGVDLILVAFIQVWSYPFHDPVMTDRAFVTDKKVMLKSFCIAGVCGVLFIVLFSTVGIYNKVTGIGGNSTITTATTLGLPILILMNLIMITSGTSTIDSAFSSVGKLISVDLLPRLKVDKIWLARGAMIVLGFIGNLMVHAGPAILSATTVSGTMVIGLTPVFLFSSWKRAGAWSFHGSVWLGLLCGLLSAIGWAPYHIGTGQYGGLLWINLVGVTACVVVYVGLGFLKPAVLK